MLSVTPRRRIKSLAGLEPAPEPWQGPMLPIDTTATNPPDHAAMSAGGLEPPAFGFASRRSDPSELRGLVSKKPPEGIEPPPSPYERDKLPLHHGGAWVRDQFGLPHKRESPPAIPDPKATGGVRTHDLFLTKETLFQLSYSGVPTKKAPETAVSGASQILTHAKA